MFEGKKILVTGGTGVLGTNLVKRLLETAAEVSVTIHNKRPDYKAHTHIYCDLTKETAQKLAIRDIDYVIHCASVVKGAVGMQNDPTSLIAPNVIMNCLLLEESYRAGVKKFIFFGSTTSYPESGDRAVKEEELFQGDPYPKYFGVGWMKRYGEKLCELYNQLGMQTIILRPSNIYGPHDKFDPDISHVTPALIRKVVERQNPLEVWGDGNDVRDLICVDDLVDAIFLALENPPPTPLNIGSGEAYSVKEILATICDIEKFYPQITFNPDKPTMIPKRYVDVSKAINWGFKAKTSLKEGLRKTIEWYKNEVS